jgi:hypothetical protein
MSTGFLLQSSEDSSRLLKLVGKVHSVLRFPPVLLRWTMMIRSRGFWTLFAVSVTLIALGDAPSAQAGCGHYVIIGGEQKTQPDMKTDRVHSPPLTPAQHHPAPLPSPCSGPRCSQKQLPFSPPPSIPVSVEDDRWSNARFTKPHSADALCWLSLDSSALQPLDSLTSIYHPPR